MTSLLKEQLALLGSLVLFVGLVSTEAYYAAFQVSYQHLSLPASHVVLRGLTVLVDAPYLLLPYAAAVAWLLRNDTKRKKQSGVPAPVLTYVFLAALVCLTYPLAQHAGLAQADRDSREGTSRLPRVSRLELEGADASVTPLEIPYRVLVTDGDFVFLIRPIPVGETATTANTRRISKGRVHEIETTP